MAVEKLTRDTFEGSVSRPGTPVLIDFFATWCMPCRMVSPVVDEIAEENPAFGVYKVDVDEEPELARRFGVASIPTLVVLKDGEVRERSVGARPKEDIINMLKRA